MPSGQVVTIDKGVLEEMLDLLASAIGAVERGNNRAAAVKTERRCTAAIFATGIKPPDCPGT